MMLSRVKPTDSQICGIYWIGFFRWKENPPQASPHNWGWFYIRPTDDWWGEPNYTITLALPIEYDASFFFYQLWYNLFN